MAVSANTLFHFTDRKENLKGILKNYFFPKYSLEDLSNVIPDSKISAANIPMVCFCDLLFSQIKYHIDFYGDYGIGLQKKEWGLAKGISPIVYVPKESKSALLIQSIEIQLKTLLKKKDSKEEIQKQITDFFKYIKVYEGIAQNKISKKMEYRAFYDEREWRYAPMKFRVLEEKEATENILKKENKKMQEDEKLIFNAKNIKYIIVREEDEIPEFVDFIEEDLKDKFKMPERKLLVSKLISVQQIRDDM